MLLGCNKLMNKMNNSRRLLNKLFRKKPQNLKVNNDFCNSSIYYSNQPYYQSTQSYNQNLEWTYYPIQYQPYYQQQEIFQKQQRNFSEINENAEKKKVRSKIHKKVAPKLKIDSMKDNSVILHLVLENLIRSIVSAKVLPMNLVKNIKQVTEGDSNEMQIDIEIELDLSDFDLKK